MIPTKTLSAKIRQLLIILGPIFVTQIALSAMNFADTMMSGHFSPVDLAGVAIGSSLWFPVYTGLNGILLALTPIVAQHLGANRKKDIAHAVFQGILLGVAIAFAVILLGGLVMTPILTAMELEDDVRHIAREYLFALAWGIVPLFVYTVLRGLIDAHGKTRTTMIITLSSLPINVFCNYVLIFGKWGFPRLGGVGSGYASALTYWIITLMALWVIVFTRPFADYRVLKQTVRISWSAWKEQLTIGIPMGIAIFFEVSIFSAVALLMSAFGTTTIAAHQAAINFSSMMYMMPLSVSMALTIAVGFEVGANRIRDAIQYSYLGIGGSLMMAVMIATSLFIFNKQVAGLYTTDPQVLTLIQSFLHYAVFFQLSDALAAPIQGILRGYKDVNVTLLLSLISYWAIGLPLGYVLANYTSLGPYGYWVGLISGLASGAMGLSWRLRHIQRTYQKQPAIQSAEPSFSPR